MAKTLRHAAILLSVWAVLGTFLLPRVSPVYAQRPVELPSGEISPYGYVPEADSTRRSGDGEKPKRPRKPLESYYFDDSVRMRRIFSWRFDPYNNNIRLVEVDTMLNRFELDYPYFHDSDVGPVYLGNLGAASAPLNYFLRPGYSYFSFLESFDAYLYTPERARFFNVKRPFTELAYFTSGQKLREESQLRVLHAQNISPSTGFNIDYKNRGTRGMYEHQKSKDKNLSLAFAHSGKRYSVHAGYIYNMGSFQENGGVKGDWQITDTIIDLPENIVMRLTDAKTKFKGNTLYVTQSYGIPLGRVSEEDFSIADKTTVFVGHSIEYTKYRKTYYDTKAGAEDYYKNWYYNPDLTRDSLSESRFDAKLFTQFQPYDREGILGTVDGGIGYTRNKYYQFTMEQYLKPGDGVKKNSFYLFGSANGSFKKYISWQAETRYYLAGYRNQDFYLGGNLTFAVYTRSGKPVTLSVAVSHNRQSPDYWSENYFSNHYVWHNSFDKEIETRLAANLSIESIGTEVGAWQSAVKNRIYYDAQSLPAQYGGTLSMTGVYARKDFRAGGFHFNHRVLLQWSSAQEVAPVPLVSANGSYFFEFNVVKDVLRMQVGLDAYYNTKYYSYGYNPALSQFYNQREVKTGNYLWMDAFASGKWKRLRFLVKLQHANYDLFGNREYFSVAHYPLNRRMLKIGISWGFYN